MRYAIGIASAVLAGLAFNLGVLIQKGAVAQAPGGHGLMRHLVRSRLWLGGFALQFAMGTPLYMLAVGLIGPAIVPGLMAIGLVVLALGAVTVQKERVTPPEVIGIVFIVLAVAALGLTGLSIDVFAGSMKDPGLLLRSAGFGVVLLGVALACSLLASREELRTEKTEERRAESASALHAIRAGIWYSLGNLGLGFVLAGFARFGHGIFDPGEILVFLAAGALAVGGNMVGIAATQHALSRGRAAIAIPLQNCITQVLPVGIFFLVYRPYSPGAGSFLFLGAGAALLIAGAVLLTARLAPGRKGVLEQGTGE